MTNRDDDLPNWANDRRTIGINEAADLLGIGRQSAYNAAKRGDIPTIRIGRTIRVPVVKLERMLNGEPWK